MRRAAQRRLSAEDGAEARGVTAGELLYVTAATSRGETVRGIRVNEDSFTIQVKDARERFHSFRSG
jgi:hypothetical protein